MKTKAKTELIRPTPLEDAAIDAGIAADPDTMELSDAQFADAVAAKRGRGRPVGSVAQITKTPVTFRLDPDLVDAMRASGVGWQTRVNDVLRREFLETQGRYTIHENLPDAYSKNLKRPAAAGKTPAKR